MNLYNVLIELTSEHEFSVPAETHAEAVKVAKLIYGKDAVKKHNVWLLDPEMCDVANEYKKLKEKK